MPYSIRLLSLLSAVALITAFLSLPAGASSCACDHEGSLFLAQSYPGQPYPGQSYPGTGYPATPYPASPYQAGAQSTTIQGGTQGALIQGNVEQEGGPVNVLILIDASYSMKENLGPGEPKMTSAKRVLESTLTRIPPDVNLGLRVFGQSYSGSQDIDCEQSALLVPIGNGNRRSIIESVRQVRPFGLTPLTYALMQAERDLRNVQGSKTIILISDGAETCGGDPCAYIARLRAVGVKIKVDIVGLGMRREKDARAQLNCIAQKSGGNYYDANTAAELADSISHMVNSAISGRVITKMKQPVVNTETQPESTDETPPANPNEPIPMVAPVVPHR